MYICVHNLPFKEARLSAKIVVRHISRVYLVSSKPVPQCIVQRLSHTSRSPTCHCHLTVKRSEVTKGNKSLHTCTLLSSTASSSYSSIFSRTMEARLGTIAHVLEFMPYNAQRPVSGWRSTIGTRIGGFLARWVSVSVGYFGEYLCTLASW